jgi:pyruvate/2-oxoglutarate dehydrogenase complex dihydrolipoamide dehydrogenase (E3) component
MEKRYDLIVIGAGAAGMAAATVGIGLGKRVAMVERELFGGDCTHYGCIPSKTMIRISRAWQFAKNLEPYGIQGAENLQYDFSQAMKLVSDTVKRVYEEETPEAFSKLGIDTYQGQAKFVEVNRITVGDTVLYGDKFVIATGSHQSIPKIEGLKEYHTHRSIFQITDNPKSMAIIGAGSVGVEIAQAFQRFGTQVELFSRHSLILPHEDQELAFVLLEELQNEGIHFHPKTHIRSVEGESGDWTLKDSNGKTYQAASILIATGKAPNTSDLGLTNMGLLNEAGRLILNTKLQTKMPHIYAAGDVLGEYGFSHMAEHTGILAAMNAILPVQSNYERENLSWVIFSDPEFAHLGLTEMEARTRYGEGIQVYRFPYHQVDRAKSEGKEKGMMKVIVDRHNHILGAHIFGERAGELIHEVGIYKQFGLKLSQTQQMVYAYPTYSELFKQVGRQAYLDHLQEKMPVKLFSRFLQIDYEKLKNPFKQ